MVGEIEVRNALAKISCGGALVALLCVSATPVAAHGATGGVVSPLPASNYSVRPLCNPPAPGRASCLARRLVPETRAARAHTRPLGMPRPARMRAGRAASPCELAKTAANGCFGLRPQDLHSAYALPSAGAAEQTVALVDAFNDPTAEADLEVYDKEFHLSPCTTANGCFTKVNQQGRANPPPKTEGGWAVEISLDIETAHAVCESCHILLVEASSESFESLDAAEATASRLGATEISNSWSGEEPTTDSSVFNRPGTVITAATGDEGYLNWQSEFPEERGLVGYPASSPHVVAVGGTRLSLTAEGAWAGETVWNGDGATGGGCSAKFEAPLWQRQLPNWTAVGCGSRRALADVSADADPFTGVAIYDSTPAPPEEPGAKEEVLGWVPIGGTSLSSPLIAAAFALAGGAHGVEYPAKTLYEAQAKLPGSLHDIQSGSNGECLQPFNPEGLSGCTAAEEARSSCSSRAICLAGPGYDGPSGVGAPDGLGAFQPQGGSSGSGKQAQTIEFSSSAPGSADVGGPTYDVSATASSGLAVTFSSGTPPVCSVAGSTVSFNAAGTCTIEANQAGNAEWEPAAPAQQSFTVSKRAQTLTFNSAAPTSAAVGGQPYSVAVTASSGLPVSLSSATPAVCSLHGSNVTFVGAGTCTIDANQAGNSEYAAASQAQQSFAVAKGSQRVEFTSSAPGSAVVGGPTYPVAGNASSGLPVSFSSPTPSVCSVQGTTVSFIGAGTCTIEADQAGNADYGAAAPAQQSFSVGRRAQQLAFNSTAPTSAAVGGPTYTVTAAASSGLPVSLSSATPSVCSLEGATVGFVAAGTCTIDADQGGDAEYSAAARMQQSFAVAPAPTQTPVPTTTTPLPTPATPALTLASEPPLSPLAGRSPNSNFKLLGNPSIDPKTGVVTFTAKVTDPGRFSWLLTFQNGTYGVFAARKRTCPAGGTLLGGHCRPARVVFGKAASTVAAGTVSLEVLPGPSAIAALRHALAKRQGLRVSAVLTFQSSMGGAPVSQTHTITVALAGRASRGKRSVSASRGSR